MGEQANRRRMRASLRGRGREILTGDSPEDASIGGADANALRLTAMEVNSLLAMQADADDVISAPSVAEDEDLILAWQQTAPAIDHDSPPDSEIDRTAANQNPPPGVEEGNSPALLDVWSDEQAPQDQDDPVAEAFAAPREDDLLEHDPGDIDVAVPENAVDVDGAMALSSDELEALVVGAAGGEPEAVAVPVPEEYDSVEDEAPQATQEDYEAWADLIVTAAELIESEDLKPHFLPEFDRIADQPETEETGGRAQVDVPGARVNADALPVPVFSEPSPVERLPIAYSYAEMATVIDDEMLRRLTAQIEALQDDLAQSLEFNPVVVEVWQRQLFEAHMQLVQSRVFYETARMAVVGIQTEMSHQRRVHSDVMRYRPLLLNYIVGWCIAWIVLMALKGMVVGIADTIGLTLVAEAYYPVLFGVLGALVGSYLALEQHAVHQRDFDPLYITGYLASPLLGGAAGLLAFLVLGLINHHVLDGTITDLERIVLWIVAVIVGLNQSAILRRVSVLFSRTASRAPDQST